MADSRKDDFSSEDDIIFVFRDEKCKKINLVISSKKPITGNEFIQYLENFIQENSENIDNILAIAPKIIIH